MNRLSRLWWRTTLRGRLLAGLLALLAVVCVVIGIVSVSALHDQTLSQVDRQLQAAGDRTANPFGGGQGGPGGFRGGAFGGRTSTTDTDITAIPGQAAGTLSGRIANGTVTAAGILTGGYTLVTGSGPKVNRTDISASDYPTLVAVPADGKPHTISLAGQGQYRVLITPEPDSTNGSTLITGLPLKDANSTISNVTWAIVIVAAAGLLGAAVIGSLVVRFALLPLRRVADTATRVSELQLDRGEVALQERVQERDTDPRTEVGQVGSALNSMLGHVATALHARQRSEMRVRQFVADASHELRTPLAAIRGYAELTRRTGADLPDDITYAMGRVESEATRMTGLVEDLLLLARLDSGRPLEQQPVDLTAVVIDAVSDAQVAGPDHPVALVLPDEAVEVIGDPARLHQVLTNLLTNARTHTAPGTPVEVALHRAPDAVMIDVTDEGPGIPTDLQPRIFERFARGDSARSRQAGSTGLGLAIVSAVTSAHGGSVSVESRPGRTAFRVILPVHGTGSAPSAVPASLPTSRTLQIQ